MDIADQQEVVTLPSEIRNFFLWFNMKPGSEKITIGSGVKGEHYTIRFWSKRRCLDLHITNELTGKHETVFEIKYFTLLKLMVRLAKVQERLIRDLWFNNTVNLGKLKHHNCILFAQLTEEDEASDFLKIKGGYFKPRKNIDLNKFTKLYLTPNQLLHSDKETFQVYKFKKGCLRWQGFIYKLANRRNERQFIFVTNKNFNTFNRELMIAAIDLLNTQIFENKEQIMTLLYEKLNDKNRKKTAA